MNSEFERWFKAQFGKRRTFRPKRDDAQLRDAIAEGKYADTILTYRQEWDKRYAAALKAWYARDYKKGKKK